MHAVLAPVFSTPVVIPAICTGAEVSAELLGGYAAINTASAAVNDASIFR